MRNRGIVGNSKFIQRLFQLATVVRVDVLCLSTRTKETLEALFGPYVMAAGGVIEENILYTTEITTVMPKMLLTFLVPNAHTIRYVMSTMRAPSMY